MRFYADAKPISDRADLVVASLVPEPADPKLVDAPL